MPQRAFDLMHGVGELDSVLLLDHWAERQIELVARDFSTLPLTARLLVDHLTQPQSHPPSPASATKAAAPASP